MCEPELRELKSVMVLLQAQDEEYEAWIRELAISFNHRER